MNEEQKEYTVKQIEKYEKENEEIYKQSLKYAVLLVAGFAITTVSAVVSCGDIIVPVLRILECALSGTGAVLSAGALWGVVDSLCTKAGLENRIADLQYKLANLENTEEKGRGL